MTQLPKWPHDQQHSNLALTGLDGQPEKPDPINWLVMSSPLLKASEAESSGCRVSHAEERPMFPLLSLGE